MSPPSLCLYGWDGEVWSVRFTMRTSMYVYLF